jgi:hypothetical protein
VRTSSPTQINAPISMMTSAARTICTTLQSLLENYKIIFYVFSFPTNRKIPKSKFNEKFEIIYPANIDTAFIVQQSESQQKYGVVQLEKSNFHEKKTGKTATGNITDT